MDKNEVVTVGDLIAYWAEYAEMDTPVYIGICSMEPIKTYALREEGLGMNRRLKDGKLFPVSDSGKQTVAILSIDLTDYEEENDG